MKQYIRLFRDWRDTCGVTGDRNYASKITGPTENNPFDKPEEALSETIKKVMDEAYNKGVDDCLRFVKMGLSHSELVDDRSAVSLLNALIGKLEKLKSK